MLLSMKPIRLLSREVEAEPVFSTMVGTASSLRAERPLRVLAALMETVAARAQTAVAAAALMSTVMEEATALPVDLARRIPAPAELETQPLAEAAVVMAVAAVAVLTLSSAAVVAAVVTAEEEAVVAVAPAAAAVPTSLPR